MEKRLGRPIKPAEQKKVTLALSILPDLKARYQTARGKDTAMDAAMVEEYLANHAEGLEDGTKTKTDKPL